MVYLLGVKKQVPDALSLCVDAEREDEEVCDKIPTAQHERILVTDLAEKDTEAEELDLTDHYDDLNDQTASGDVEGLTETIGREELTNELEKEGFCRDLWVSGAANSKEAREPKDWIFVRKNPMDPERMYILI